MISLNRSLVNEDRRKDRETLTLLRKDYQLYKDQWGLNVKYSQEAGESKNFSKPFLYTKCWLHIIYANFLSCQDPPGTSSR